MLVVDSWQSSVAKFRRPPRPLGSVSRQWSDYLRVSLAPHSIDSLAEAVVARRGAALMMATGKSDGRAGGTLLVAANEELPKPTYSGHSHQSSKHN